MRSGAVGMVVLWATVVGAAPPLLDTRFDLACALADGGTPTLSDGWTAFPSPSSSDTRVICTDGGLRLTGTDGDLQLHVTLFPRSGRELTSGRYVLSGLGSGGYAIVRDTFGDGSFASRARTVDFAGRGPLINHVEFTWDAGPQTQGLIQVRDTTLQWLRLERVADQRPSVELLPPDPSDAGKWELSPGTVLSRRDGGSIHLSSPGIVPALRAPFELSAGRYRLSVSGRGSLGIAVESGPQGAPYSAFAETFALDGGVSRLFTASGHPVEVVVQSAEVDLGSVRISPYQEATPTRAEVEQRPTPWPGRGLTAQDVTNLMPQLPRDRSGTPCVSPERSHVNDLRDLRAWGANIARVGVPTLTRARRANCRLVEAQALGADGSIDRDAFWNEAWPVILDETVAAVEAARAAGMKLVLLIEPPTPTAPIGADPTGWVDLRSRQDFARGMSELVARLHASRDGVWGYDLVNEPYTPLRFIGNAPAPQWRELIIEVIERVRETERGLGVGPTDHAWMIYEPGLFPSSTWPEQYANLTLLPDPFVIYSDHFYEPYDFTHQNISCPGGPSGYPVGTVQYAGALATVQGALNPLGEFQRRTGAPMYLGEFGAAVWAGWAPSTLPDGGVQWNPAVDAMGRPLSPNVTWMNEVMVATEALELSWTHHSFRTYYAWDPELTPLGGPCSGYHYPQPGEPDTKPVALLKSFLARNDAGIPDAGVPDAGVLDAGVIDAGVPDAGGGVDGGAGMVAPPRPCGCSTVEPVVVGFLLVALLRRREERRFEGRRG